MDATEDCQRSLQAKKTILSMISKILSITVQTKIFNIFEKYQLLYITRLDLPENSMVE
jgi:hypothetical protein